MTIDALRECGADVDAGLKRCMNNEAFYLRLVGKGLEDRNFDKLKEALAAKDLDAAFECAHALKGVMGNLSLSSIYDPVCEITELLRSRTDKDYTEELEKILGEREKLMRLGE